MKVNSVEKNAEPWASGDNNLSQSSTVESDIVETIPSSIAEKGILNRPESFGKIDSTASAALTDTMQAFDYLLNTLYGSVDQTVLGKSIKELWHERMLEKHG